MRTLKDSNHRLRYSVICIPSYCPWKCVTGILYWVIAVVLVLHRFFSQRYFSGFVAACLRKFGCCYQATDGGAQRKSSKYVCFLQLLRGDLLYQHIYHTKMYLEIAYLKAHRKIWNSNQPKIFWSILRKVHDCIINFVKMILKLFSTKC